jgi:hypothetical protein
VLEWLSVSMTGSSLECIFSSKSVSLSIEDAIKYIDSTSLYCSFAWVMISQDPAV